MRWCVWAFLLFNLSLVSAGELESDFASDLGSTVTLNSDNFPDSLTLGIDSVRFEQGFDTILNHSIEWGTGDAGNISGAAPTVRYKGAEGRFFVEYIGMNSLAPDQASANNMYGLEVNIFSPSLITHQNTLGELNHKTNLTVGFKYTNYYKFLGGNNLVPAAPDLDVIGDQYISLWPTVLEHELAGQPGNFPIQMAHYTAFEGIYDAHPITWTDDNSHEDSTTDTGYVTTVNAEIAAAAVTFLENTNGLQYVTLFGPACYKLMREDCYNDTPRDQTIWVRWENVSTGITKLDSIEPTVPATNSYNLGVVDDGSGGVLTCWGESGSGTEIWCQAWDAARNRLGGPEQIESSAEVRIPLDEGYASAYDIEALGANRYLIVYARSGDIIMRDLTVSGAGISVGADRVLDPSGSGDCSFPTISVNDNYVGVSYFREIAVNTRRVEVIRYERSGPVSVLEEFVRVIPNLVSFTSIQADRDHIQTWLSPSTAVDTSGNILIGYNDELDARITAYTNVPVYGSPGHYFSDLLDLAHPLSISGIQDGDSVQFKQLQHFGPDTNRVTSYVQMASQFDFSDASDLASHTLMSIAEPVAPADSFFRYRIQLESQSDNLTSPSIDSLYLSWNLKPRAPVVNSITIGTSLDLTEVFEADSAYTVTNRLDSIFLDVSADDLDIPAGLDLIAWTDANPEVPWVVGGASMQSTMLSAVGETFSDTLVILPVDTLIDTLIVYLSVSDGEWISEPTPIKLSFQNDPPSHTVGLQFYDGAGTLIDTITDNDSTYWVLATDSLRLDIWADDVNDTMLTIEWDIYNSSTTWHNDSINDHTSGDTLKLRFQSYSTARNEPDTIVIRTADADTSIFHRIILLPNHGPILDSLIAIGYRQNGNFVAEEVDRNVSPGSDPDLYIHPEVPMFIASFKTDVDEIWGDSVEIEWHRLHLNPTDGLCCIDTLISTADTLEFSFAAAPPYKLRVFLRDQSNLTANDTFTLLFPYLDTSGLNLEDIISELTDSLDFLIGGGKTGDTISFSIPNNGQAPLRISGAETERDAGDYMDYLLSWPGGSGLLVETKTDSSRLSENNAIVIATGADLDVTLQFDLSGVTGDSVINDTLYLTTNDFHNPILKIPFRIEFNDLPTVTVYRVPNNSSERQAGGYPRDTLVDFFPFYSSLYFAFSEPIDTRNIEDKLLIYSVPDSVARGINTITPMEAYYSGSYAKRRNSANTRANYFADTLVFTPDYKSPSDHFNFTPPPLSFMHSDTIHIYMSNSITDAFGNPLDIHNINLPADTGTVDTVIERHIDTSMLQVVSTYPEDGDSIFPDEAILVHFNYPLTEYNILGDDSILSLDFSTLAGDSNQTLTIRSHYSKWQPIDLKSMTLLPGDTTLQIRPRYNFFSEDSVRIRLSYNISDIYGRTLDGNEDRRFVYPPDTADYFEFSFFTGQMDFYTFPNPFKFRDPRHLEKGGIAFKNLHQIKGLNPEKPILIRIYSIDGTLVYSTKRQKFEMTLADDENAPEWIWEVENNHQRTVASGVYIYTIGHKHKVHKKGKLVVIH